MKRFIKSIAAVMLLSIVLNTSSCMIFQRRKLPPGQEKKVEHDQSAKEYAPGQQDKKD
jgi:hypothetical protein